MSLTKRVGLVVGALSLTGAAYAETGADQDVQARIADLEAQVARLKAENQGEWLTEARATEIRTLVQDVLQDADTRASLLQGGMGGGHDGNGFYIGSADGNFRLNLRGQMQIRFIFNHQDDGDGDGEGFIDSTRYGFENARTKLIFDGHIVDPSWTYKIEGDFSRSGGGFTLLDAWINYDFGNGWGLKFGQFKAPGGHEELVDSSMQQAVERSLVNGTFTPDRVQGVMLHYGGEQFRAGISFNDGIRSLNGPWSVMDTEYAFTGRAEFLAAGNWDQFDDFTSWRGEEFGLLIGGAFHVQGGEAGGPGTEVDIMGFTLDATAEFGGANVYGAFVWADIDDDAFLDASPWGFELGGGFMVADDLEIFGRFEWGDTDDLFSADSEDLMIFTLGVTKFFNGHDLKWTSDIGFAFDEVDPFWTLSGDADLAGWRSDLADEDGQIVFRTQLQLLF
jgi:hypothetical protein